MSNESFKDRSWLVTALQPAKGDRDPALTNNDDLEFLGDSVLELIAPHFLHPGAEAAT